MAGQAIEAAGATKEAVTAAAEAALPPAGEPNPQHMPFSAGVKRLHELIVREPQRLGHNYIGTEHILLGLLEAHDEPGTRALTELGVTKPDVEVWTLQALADLRS